MYDQYFITLYNIVYTSLPVLAMGVFDQVRWVCGEGSWVCQELAWLLCGACAAGGGAAQLPGLVCPSEGGACLGQEGGAQSALCPQDVPEQRSMEYPKLYEPGQLNLLFNKREFFICIAQGIYTSVLMFFIPYGVFADATRDDGAQLADYQSFAVTVATSLVIVVSVQVRGTAAQPRPLGPVLPCGCARSTAAVPEPCLLLPLSTRSGWTRASGRPSTTSSSGAAWPSTLPSSLPCTATASSRCFPTSSASWVSPGT